MSTHTIQEYSRRLLAPCPLSEAHHTRKRLAIELRELKGFVVDVETIKLRTAE